MAWTPFPYPLYSFDAETLRAAWPRLHRGDAEPLPADPAVLEVWRLYHAGEFQHAVQTGLAVGGDGLTAANKAQLVHASYVEPGEARRLALLREVAERAASQTASHPRNANAHYLLGCALGRLSQGVNVSKALSQGVGPRVREALETALRLQPAHAEACIVLGAFHAEVLDKLGSMVGRTQGVSVEGGLRAFRQALKLHPDSVLARLEYARGLLMIEGEPRQADAERLIAEAAAVEAADAVERLHVERARAELLD